MPEGDLSEGEKEELDDIINDLEVIFKKEEISPAEIDDLESKLKSDRVKKYLRDLRAGSKPETALREAILASESPFAKFLSGEISPDVTITEGFIDYKLKVDGSFILLELKPLFTARRDKEGKLLELKQERLDWKKHEEQIGDYTKENEFLIFTNLKSWYFFSSRGKAQVINEENINLAEFCEDFRRAINLRDYFERIEERSIRGDLDKIFFKSLAFWVNQLESIEFNDEVSASTKIESIINLINKFIFIQTLDDYSVVNFQWIQNKWLEKERDWRGFGKKEILKEFIDEVNKWFYRYYDTELFRGSILDYVKDDKGNLEKLYDKLELILGLKHWQSVLGGEERGITNYNYRRIDEDIFGRAYEEFLADIRKEEGIYYTRKYITQYITENTVSKRFDQILQRFEIALEHENFDEAETVLQEFTFQKILDPACGSGSFLIKAIRIVWRRYARILTILSNKHDEYAKGKRTLDLPVKKLDRIKHLREILGGKDKNDLMSKLILRHIYGNDKDARALSVAKVNLWLEAIKLIPEEFRYDRIQEMEGYVLPDLEMNLGHGDSLVGLPVEEATKYLKKDYQEELQELTELRNRYLANPRDGGSMRKINQMLSELRAKLDEEFAGYLDANELPKGVLKEIVPFHWGLQFWHAFDEENSGFDIIIGNPPYERIQNLKKTPYLVDYFNETYETSYKNYDIAVIFTEKGYDLLKPDGIFGYIMTKKWMTADYGEKLREILSHKKAVTQIVDFGDQQAFKGPLILTKSPITYTILLFLQKAKSDKFKYAHVKDLKHQPSQLEKIDNHEQLTDDDLFVDMKTYEEVSSDPWVLTLREEKEILNKLSQHRTLSDIRDRIFQGLVTGADPVFILELLEEDKHGIKVYSKETEKEYLIEKEVLKPLLKGDEIDKWSIRGFQYVILFPYNIYVKDSKRSATLIDKEELKENYPKAWDYLTENKERLEARESGKWKGKKDWYAYGRRQNIEQFEQEKIVTQVLASVSSLALDRDGVYYFVGGGGSGGYGVTIKDESRISYPYLLGLLNSLLLEWRLKKESSQFKGGYYTYARRYIEKLPVKYDKEKEEKIVNAVERAIALSKIRYKIEEKWPEISRKLKNSERTLSKILKSDREALQTGNREKIWTIDVSFYPDEEDDRLEKEFPRFKFAGNPESFTISIYGIDGQREERIFEMEFKDKDLMKIVYLSLKELLGSGKKVGNLNHIFSKTMVPVIQPGIRKNTPNIIKEIEERIIEWQDKKDFEEDIKPDIIKVENGLQEIENELDAHVFDLYDLSRDEILTVLDSLGVIERMKNKILKKFNDLR